MLHETSSKRTRRGKSSRKAKVSGHALRQQWYRYLGLAICHDCKAAPGQVHGDGCDMERCSVCGGQRLVCDCKGHDKAFARWTGLIPGLAEANSLGMDLNDFYKTGIHLVFFIKPKVRRS